MDKVTLRSHRYWSIICVVFFGLLIYYARTYSKTVYAQNIIGSAIISWSSVSFLTLFQIIKNERALDGKFIALLVRRLSKPFAVLLFVEFALLIISRADKELMMIFIASVSAVTIIFLSLTSLLEFSIWFNQRKRNRRS
jgi:hypothetical protein